MMFVPVVLHWSAITVQKQSIHVRHTLLWEDLNRIRIALHVVIAVEVVLNRMLPGVYAHRVRKQYKMPGHIGMKRGLC